MTAFLPFDLNISDEETQETSLKVILLQVTRTESRKGGDLSESKAVGPTVPSDPHRRDTIRLLGGSKRRRLSDDQMKVYLP
jgi:hypothetical protein